MTQFQNRTVESRNITSYENRSTAHFLHSYLVQQRRKMEVFMDVVRGCLLYDSDCAYQQVLQVDAYVQLLGIMFSMNILQGIGFKYSRQKICF